MATTSTYIVNAYVGDLEVIAYGTIHVTPSTPLRLIYDNLHLNFIFLNDEKVRQAKEETEVIDNTLNLKLYNYNNGLGEGILVPQKLGDAFDRVLYFTYWVWTPDAATGRRIISYNILLGERFSSE